MMSCNINLGSLLTNYTEINFIINKLLHIASTFTEKNIIRVNLININLLLDQTLDQTNVFKELILYVQVSNFTCKREIPCKAP